MSGFWGRRLTVLVLASAQRPAWRAQVSLPLSLLVLAFAGGLAAWCAVQAGRLVDYRVTKAENTAMRARLTALVDEMSRSRAELEVGKQADRELRVLLNLPVPPEARRQAAKQPSAAPPSGAGGPDLAERDALLRKLLVHYGPGVPGDFSRRFDDLRRLSRERAASLREISGNLAWRRRLLQVMPRGWPALGRMTSAFGRRLSPMRFDRLEFHPGLDIANTAGMPIRATADGVVARARWTGGYGRMIVIRHPMGYSTLYGHAARLIVREGDRVGRGQVIAAMGNTGRSTGSHVHYEVWWRNRPLNPVKYLRDYNQE
ncbi:MAG: M23 family metallopeptidase [Elusimicrobia bacterium]|nr:M23 family metallopeptidase [Elusimicrobiota bacterium]